MSIGLLDVNMLVALGWSSHAHHHLARQWFVENRASGWATCPITECGFIRLSANPAFTPDAVTPADAVTLLQQLKESGNHVFWPADLPVESELIPTRLVAGHRQVTDGYLLGLAIHHGGKLVTLDQKLAESAARDPDLTHHVEVVPTAAG